MRPTRLPTACWHAAADDTATTSARTKPVVSKLPTQRTGLTVPSAQVVAIIPARGGSKGVPRKNVKTLCGFPLIAHMIESALAASSVERVIVSTDDVEIGDVATRFGADVQWRPADLSGDTASSEAALLHALETLEREQAFSPELTVFLQCTSPLTRSEDIDGVVRALIESDADCALTVAPFHRFLWREQQDGTAAGINHDPAVRELRQQRAPQYIETGGVYAMRTEGFLEARHRFFGRVAMHCIPEGRSMEIDEPVDFRIAEALLRDAMPAAPGLLRKPAAIVFDFDGVFTDNRVLVLEDGREAVVCDRGDGMGLGMLKESGIPILVLSKEINSVVQARCDKLDLECRHGINDKLSVLGEWCAQKGIALSEVVYVGNDVNDLECLGAVGCGVVPSDAHPKAAAAARVILTAPGGRGAVRELADLVIDNAKRDSSH